jgi:hypothetical protein
MVVGGAVMLGGLGRGRPSSPQELRQGDELCRVLKRQHVADIRAIVD